MGLMRSVRAQIGISAVGLMLASAVFGAPTVQAFPPDQVTRGEAVFNHACAECHGPDSTDPEAPLLLRPDSLRRFPNAAAAHKFISTEMPSDTPGTLAPEEYWDVVAYLLTQSGINGGDAPLGPDTAASIATRSAGSTRGAPAPKPETPPAAPETPPAEGEGTPPPAP